MIIDTVRDYFLGIDWLFVLKTVLRIAMAALFGGIIGNEREHTNRPAGLRTHMLVCVGASIVMLTSEFMLTRYAGKTNLDPTRLGAQVISGIGFLGAGTIIKEGFTVQGLTTAASLWAVSCIGLAIGSGYYVGAIVATAVIYMVLELLKRMILKKVVKRMIAIEVSSIDNVLSEAEVILHRMNIAVSNTEVGILPDGDGTPKTVELRFFVTMPKDSQIFELVITKLKAIDSVKSIHIS